MKSILTIGLMIIGMISWGQEKLAVIDEWWYYPPTPIGDSLYVYHYDYLDSNLEVIYKWHFWKNKLEAYQWEFDNDSCVRIITSDSVINVVYYIDSVLLKDDDDVLQTFYIDNNNRVYKRIKADNTYDYVWDNGNMIECYKDGELEYYCEYYPSYLNPWYKENRYLKGYNQTGFMAGSYNLVQNFIYAGGDTTFFEVLELEDDFPKKIKEHYQNSTMIGGVHRFYYYNIINDTPEISSEHTLVLSVDYYDIIGRKIPKPITGFYIERMTTNKGVISKKYYIQ